MISAKSPSEKSLEIPNHDFLDMNSVQNFMLDFALFKLCFGCLFTHGCRV